MGTRNVQSWMLAVLLGAGTLAAEEVAPAPEQVAPESVTVALKDGGRLVGTIVSEDEAAVTLRTGSGLELRLLREAIASIQTGSVTNGDSRPTPSDPNDTRLMFAPTGRPLGKGNGYFSDHYVLFPGFAYGLTRNLSIAGGFSTVPGVGLDEQLFYVNGQAAFQLSEKAALAVGGLYAAGADEELDAGVLYGVTTLGRPDRSLTLGFALGSTRQYEDEFGPRGQYLGSRTHWRSEPIVIVGGSLRVAKRLALVSESWLFLEKPLSEQPFGLALRFFSDRISVDVGFVLVPEVLDEGFPIPWLSFSYHFGPSRSASKRLGSGSRGGLETARLGRR